MANTSKRWAFRPRYIIKGTLHTRTPIFTGSGSTIPHPEIETKREENSPAEVMAFPCAENTPFIPGHTLKGALKDWISRHSSCRSLIHRVFGKGPEHDKEGETQDYGRGGAARFLDAVLKQRRMEPTPLPCWNPGRQTYIEAHVCMDRVTGTAAENMLYYQETVPAGIGFEVEIHASLGPEEHKKEAALLLAALDGFNHADDPILLGADTASAKGQMEWELCSISVMDRQEVESWLKGPCNGHYRGFFRRLDHNELYHLLSLAKTICSGPEKKEGLLSFSVTINFDSHFLINDPPGPEEIKKKKREESPDEPDMRPLKDEMDRPALSASAVKGALRSQAERIVRTMTLDPKCACHPDINPCRMDKLEDYKNLCPACKVFGAPGWKSPLYISRFECIDSGREMTQEFLAVDRFTGGGMHGAKFNARAFYKPRFRGEIRLDLERMKKIREEEDPSWAIGLLALVLRDLKEGDITFGLGASKGYGTCTAEIAKWNSADFQERVESGLAMLKNSLNTRRTAQKA